MESCDNAYTIDLTYAKSAADVIYDLSSCLDNDLAKNRRILLKLGDIALNKSQLMSVRSLVNSVNSTLSFLETESLQTKAAALDLGVIVSTKAADGAEQEAQPEQTYKPVEEIGVETGFSKRASAANEALDEIFSIEQKLGSMLEPEEKSAVKPVEVDYTASDYEIDTLPMMYVKQTLRSGQVLSFDGNIFIIGDTHPGSEIVATGDITVWGALGGIAHAGSKGNIRASIRALKMNAIQLRISDCYARRPDSLNTIFVEKTDTFTPEQARIVDEEIVIFKMND